MVDIQLENNRIQEDAEAVNFDFNNKVGRDRAVLFNK